MIDFLCLGLHAAINVYITPNTYQNTNKYNTDDKYPDYRAGK